MLNDSSEQVGGNPPNVLPEVSKTNITHAALGTMASAANGESQCSHEDDP